MNDIAKTLKSPYYAVIFTRVQTDNIDGYSDTAGRMCERAAKPPGYLGFESARDGLGIAVSYFLLA